MSIISAVITAVLIGFANLGLLIGMANGTAAAKEGFLVGVLLIIFALRPNVMRVWHDGLDR